MCGNLPPIWMMSGYYPDSFSYAGLASTCYTDSMRVCPADVYPAKQWTNVWEHGNYLMNPDNMSYYNYCGDVIPWARDSFNEYGVQYDPFSTSARLFCQMKNIGESGACKLNTKFALGWADGVVSSLSPVKDHEALKDKPELQKKVNALIAKAKAIRKQYETMIRNASQGNALNDSIALSEAAAPIYKEAKELYEKEILPVVEAYNEAETKRREAEAQAEIEKAAADAAAGTGSGSGSGGISGGYGSIVTDPEAGDDELTEAQCQERYKMSKEAIIPECTRAKTIASLIDNATDNFHDDDNEKGFDKYLGDKDGNYSVEDPEDQVNGGNVLEVIEAFGVSKFVTRIKNKCDDYDDKDRLKRVIVLIKARRDALIADNAAGLTEEQKKRINEAVDALDAEHAKSGLDVGAVILCLSNVFKAFKCKINVDGAEKTVYIGTKEHMGSNLKVKQEEEKKKAVETFYKAVAPAGQKPKANLALPSGITYLPNAQKFVWKYNDKLSFNGSTYSEVANVVEAYNGTDPKKMDVTRAWIAVDDELKKADKFEAAAAS